MFSARSPSAETLMKPEELRKNPKEAAVFSAMVFVSGTGRNTGMPMNYTNQVNWER
jgi:hypothetical protein